jgi:hypothetical protein
MCCSPVKRDRATGSIGWRRRGYRIWWHARGGCSTILHHTAGRRRRARPRHRPPTATGDRRRLRPDHDAAAANPGSAHRLCRFGGPGCAEDGPAHLLRRMVGDGGTGPGLVSLTGTHPTQSFRTSGPRAITAWPPVYFPACEVDCQDKSRKWRALSSAPRSVSCRPCGIPTISAPCGTSCVATSAPSCGLRPGNAADHLLGVVPRG